MIGTIYWKISNNTLSLGGTTFSGATEWVQLGGNEAPPWSSSASTITSVDVVNACQPVSMYGFFFGFTTLTSLTLTNLDTSNVTTFEKCFVDTLALTSLTLNFDTSKATSMYGMFAINNNKVPHLATLNISSFDTSKVTDMHSMFQNQLVLTSLTHNLNTSKVTDFGKMFVGCRELTSIDVSNFDTSKAIDMSYMFDECYKVTSLNVTNFDTSNVINMERMFRACYVLTTLDIDEFDTSKVKSFNRMFSGCHALNNIDVSEWDVGQCQDFHGMFLRNYVNATIDVEDWDTHSATDVGDMFRGCYALTSIDLRKWDVSNVRDMGSMFASPTSSDTMNWTSIKVDGWDTRNVEIMEQMFGYCNLIQTIDISNFDTSNLATCKQMFYHCDALTTIYASSDFAQNIANSQNMFKYCTSIVGGNGTTYNQSYVDGASAVIDRSDSEGYFTQSTRTLTTSKTGEGTLTSSGTFNYGTEVNVIAIPNNGYYTDVLNLVDFRGTKSLSDDTINRVVYTFNLKDNTTINATFSVRLQHTLSASSTEYEVQGTGTYYYLDTPTLVLNIGQDFVLFNGWYNGQTKVSSQNPYSLVMPNEDLTLTATTGGQIFDNSPIRQFALQNSYGEVYKLTNKNSKIFLDDPSGLGFAKSISVNKFGNSEKVVNEAFALPTPKGKLVFHENENTQRYEDYYEFVRFISKKPIQLWIKIPTSENNTYHLPVEVLELSKSQSNVDKTMICNIEFHSTEFYQQTMTQITQSANEVVVYNDSDFEIGVEIEVNKLSGLFSQPKIEFYQDNEKYGGVSLNLVDVSKLIFNSKDGKQSIEKLNDGVKTKVINYLDFEYAEDNDVDFPFPKLKKGYTTIKFTYQGDSSDTKVYSINFDKGYLSV